MEPIEYKKLFEYETSYWWYRGLRAILMDRIRQLGLGPSARILDAGCGTGENLETFGKEISPHVFGCDLSARAAAYWSRRGVLRGCLATVNSMPFAENTFDVVVTVDVLYHSQVDEEAASHELWRVVRREGYLIIIVPAYQWLSSEHDRAVHSVRRYTRRRLIALLEREGAQVVCSTYLFPLFFPLVAGYRLTRKWIGKNGNGLSRSDLWRLPFVLNSLFYGIVLIEGRLLRLINFPFGSSVLLVVKKVG